MKKIFSIENKTTQDLEFIGSLFVLPPITKLNIDDNFVSDLSLHSLKNVFDQGFINSYDENDNILSKEEFYESWRILYIALTNADKNYKIYRFLSDDAFKVYGRDFSVTPKSIDYIKDVSTRFQRKLTFKKGFLVKCEYFEKSVLNEMGQYDYINPILLVTIKYIIGNDGYVYYRDVTRNWQLENGTYSENSKVTTKYYDRINAIEEGKIRRNNIFNELMQDVVGLIMMLNDVPTGVHDAENLALPFLDKNDGLVNKYFKGNIAPVINSVQEDQENEFLNIQIPFMSNITIREYIVAKLMEAILTEGEVISSDD